MSAHSKRPTQPMSMAVLVAVSVGVHAAVALFVTARMSDWREDMASLPAARAPGTVLEVPFAYACTVDIATMTSARLAYCAGPTASPDCARSALDRALSELVLCEMQTSDAPAVAKLEPAQISLVDEAAVARLQPKPLIPALPPQDPEEVAKLEQKKIEEKAEEARRQETRPSPSSQVVEITRPTLEMKPDDARYVSEYDSKVDKETVARASTDKMVARPRGTKREETPPDTTPKVLEPRESTSASKQPSVRPGRPGAPGSAGLLAMRGAEARSSRLERFDPGEMSGVHAPRSSDGLEPLAGNGRKADIGPQTGAAGGQGGNGGDGNPVPHLRPSDQMLEKMVGGGSVDKLDGVQPGIETALNSTRWKYASFFNRMKRRVAQNWHPGEVYLRRDPTGRVYGTKDRLTVLTVSLKPTGELAKLVVSEASGVDFLDEEAMHAFRAAQPFPNPPRALVNAESQLITFSFGFHFQIDGPNDAWWKFHSF